jgi:flagellar basal body rod protein FlgF
MAKRAVKRTIEEIAKPTQSKVTVTDTGFDMLSGFLRYNGRPAYIYVDDELTVVTDPKQARGKNVFWRTSELVSFQCVEFPNA